MSQPEQQQQQQTATCPEQGCKNPGRAPHPCPYQSEINYDDDWECTCCEECEAECAAGI